MHDTLCCPGKCNGPFRAAERRFEADGIPHDYEPVEGNPVWCPPCTTAIRAAIAELPELAIRLHLEVGSGVSAALTEFVSGSHERRLFEHESAAFALDELAGFLTDWDDTVRKERRLPSARPAGLGHIRAVAESSRFLLMHLTWLLAPRPDIEPTPGEAAQAFGQDLLWHHRRAQNLTGSRETEPVRCIGIPCPNCDWLALEHEIGYDKVRKVDGVATGYIRCRHCRPTFRMTEQEYGRWLRLLDNDVRRKGYATAEILAEVFGGSAPKARTA